MRAAAARREEEELDDEDAPLAREREGDMEWLLRKLDANDPLAPETYFRDLTD